jgi:hypothetical protein
VRQNFQVTLPSARAINAPRTPLFCLKLQVGHPPAMETHPIRKPTCNRNLLAPKKKRKTKTLEILIAG